jgi:hypothetical protein
MVDTRCAPRPPCRNLPVQGDAQNDGWLVVQCQTMLWQPAPSPHIAFAVTGKGTKHACARGRDHWTMTHLAWPTAEGCFLRFGGSALAPPAARPFLAALL